MPARPHVDRLKTIYTTSKALPYGWRFSDFLRTPGTNGIGIYTPQIHRITFRFDRKDVSSSGVRGFIATRLTDLAKSYPSVAVYAMPVRQQRPKIQAEYGCGRTLIVDLNSASLDDVTRDVHLLMNRSGLPVQKLESPQSASVASVQGAWTPVTWLRPELNTEPLPQPRFATHRSAEVTATEYVKSVYENEKEDSGPSSAS